MKADASRDGVSGEPRPGGPRPQDESESPRTVARRTVVQAGALAVGLSTLGLSTFAESADAATARLRRSAFSALIGCGFRATGKDVSQRLVLLEVTDLGVMPRLPKAQRAEYRQKSFAVRFSTTRAIPAGTYTLSNQRFGSHRVFLSPVDKRSEHLVEAVFNRFQG